MIYVLVGNNLKKRTPYLKELVKGYEVTSLEGTQISKDLIMRYAESMSLFGESLAVIVDGISESGIDLKSDELLALKESSTTFVFLEDKLLSADEKKYKKFAEVEKFEEKEVKQSPKVNVFAITDAFAKKDKISTWTLYLNAIESGVEPEAISGVLFWKVKTMLLGGSRVFEENNLKNQARELVFLHHKAHRGEVDFVVGLEQFILKSLS